MLCWMILVSFSHVWISKETNDAAGLSQNDRERNQITHHSYRCASSLIYSHHKKTQRFVYLHLYLLKKCVNEEQQGRPVAERLVKPLANWRSEKDQTYGQSL